MTDALLVSDADRVIDLIGHRATRVMEAIRLEDWTVQQRDETLQALVNSLIGQPNPLTGKPHSATSAEAAAKATDQYKAAHLDRLNAECGRIGAWADYEMARLRAKLAVVAAGGE